MGTWPPTGGPGRNWPPTGSGPPTLNNPIDWSDGPVEWSLAEEIEWGS